MLIRTITTIFICLFLAGCMTAAQHSQELHSSADREFTLGQVQRYISRGMSQASVAEALGSPNIVTSDDQNDETWVYDKIATEASYSNDQGNAVGGVGAGGPAGSVLILGGLFGGYSKQAGASATTQKTLTVVIKFDRNKRVKDFSYHSTKF
jgi:outer membrane protein assembly factor BamE (lipoprotein component of BamABCDE complex)